MKYPNKYNTKAIIICHGKSEVILCKSIKSNLRMPIEIASNNNGESSIQITSLIKYLNNKIFKNSKSIINNYPNIEHEKNRILNCRIFIIMDLDEKELTEEMKKNYKTGTMFKNLDYDDIIVPIYNIKNLDDVCKRIGYDIDINNKTTSYKKMFPGENGNIESFKLLKSNFKKAKGSNMYVLLDYLEECLIKFNS